MSDNPRVIQIHPGFAPTAKFTVDYDGPMDTLDIVRLLVKVIKDNNLHERGCPVFYDKQLPEMRCTCTMSQIHMY